MIKALFFDIDGTLVSFRTHQVPQSAIDAIGRVRRMGVRVFIATGRPQLFIDNLGSLEYDGIVSVNGACCTTAAGEVISNYTVPKDDIRRLIENDRISPMPIVFVSNEKGMSVNPEAAMGHLPEVFKLLDVHLPEVRPIEEALEMDVLQVIAFFTSEQEQAVMRDLLRGCDANRWHPHFADCVAKGVNKARGIDDVCKYYGFDLSETAAFGDGGNDITMLAHAGIGVAMGSAPDEVKAAADMVTDTVDDDGIAKALHKLFP